MTVLLPDQVRFDVPIRFGDVLHAGRLAIARLAQLGVATPPDHRLARAVRHVERAFAYADRDGSFVTDAVRFSEALRTMLYQYVVGRSISASDDAALALLARTLDGRDTPDQDLAARNGGRTAARDAEFELMSAALLQLGGVVGVKLGEPDLRIRAGDDEIGVAVKCIWNSDQLEKRVTKAIRQVRRHTNSGGVIVLGLDVPMLGREPEDAQQIGTRLTRRAREIVHRHRGDDVVEMVVGVGTVVAVSSAYAAERPSPDGPDAPPLVALGVSLHVEAILPPSEHAEVLARLRIVGANARRAAARVLAEARDPGLNDPVTTKPNG